MKKAEIKRSMNNLIDYISLRFTSKNRPGGKYMNRQERRLVKKLKPIFNKQMKWVVEELKNVEPFSETVDQKVKIIKTKDIESQMDMLLLDLPYNDDIIEQLVFYSGASIVKGANDRIKKMKIGEVVGTFNLQTPEVQTYLNNMADLQLSNFKGAIQKTTKDAIKEIVVEGAKEGLSYSSIAKKIREQGGSGVFSQARGELIAVREVGMAYGNGQNTAVAKYIAETGASVVKSWLTAGDNRVRDTHVQNEQDGEIPFSEPFSGTVEDYAPSEDFGCRCVSNYRTL